MLIDLTQILRAEKDIVRTSSNLTRLEQDLKKQREYKDKLVVSTFQELEIRIRKYKREIQQLKEENNSLKSQLNSTNY